MSTRGDRGAAAIEFALLVPIFCMLTFGMLTGGLAFFHNIAIDQAARDAGRYGSTLPISTLGSPPAGEVSISDWLTKVRDVAATSAGWTDAQDSTLADGGDGYVCVAYVPGGATTGSITTPTYVTAGTTRSGDGDPTASPGAATGSTCFDDTSSGRDDSRVQVVIRRDAPFNAVFLGRLWELRTTFVIPYERTQP